MAIVQIKNRFTGAVLFECDVPAEVESGLAMRHALEKATEARADLRGAYLSDAYLSDAYLSGAYLRGAYLSDAYLSGAYLRGADLSGADLSGADLSDAYLSGADLSGADLSGAYLSGEAKHATDEQATENLDRVRAIILDNKARLEMGHWHQNDEWQDRTCAEETLCSTTHCLAGWLQVCSTDEEIRKMDSPQLAGIFSAPVAAKMFFRQGDEVLSWLEERKYVGEMQKSAERRAALKAKREAEQSA